ncbi:aconitase family protein, partial [Thermodesulfobacteriota bacterium]
MGKTITEKILEKASGAEVRPGDFVRFKLTNVLINKLRGVELEALGVLKVFDPEKIKIIIAGHQGSADKLKNRYSNMLFAKKLGIPQSNIVDLGSGGVEHQVSIERGWTLPGTVFMGGVDGQTPIHGAMGCVAAPLAHSTYGPFEDTAILLTGRAWCLVPPSMMFNLRGKLQDGVTAGDVFEWILGEIGPSGAMRAMMEFTGPLVEEMSIDERVTLCCNSAFTGAFSGIINPISTEFRKNQSC